jgi:hypothetical protein
MGTLYITEPEGVREPPLAGVPGELLVAVGSMETGPLAEWEVLGVVPVGDGEPESVGFGLVGVEPDGPVDGADGFVVGGLVGDFDDGFDGVGPSVPVK